MEWRVVARPLVMRKGRRMYVYAEVRILLPAEYINHTFVIKPIEDEARLSEAASSQGEERPTWVSEAVREMFVLD